MNYRKMTIGLVACLVMGTGLFSARAEETAKIKCPVTGEPANLAVGTPTDDGPVYFCCKGCAKEYKAEPGKFAKTVAEQRKTLALRQKVQVTCPVTGKPVDKKFSIEHEGKKVNFCCGGCVGKYEADAKQYAAALANSYSYQAKCPVMGGTIIPTAFSTLASGEKIYYCCIGCEKKVMADPKKYSAILATQEILISPRKIKLAGADDDDHKGHDHGHEGHGHDGHDH